MKLLIVDDDIPTTQAISEALNWSALSIESVDIAYNVVSAKELMLATGPDIVLCDIEMPKYSGLDLIAWARDQKLEAEFIFLTCHADFTYATRALRYEASAYLIKPLDIKALRAEIVKASKKIAFRAELKKRTDYGDLWLNSRERLENALWREILFSNTVGHSPTGGNGPSYMDIDTNAAYRLVLCSVNESQLAENDWNGATFRYALGNMASELLFGRPNFARVLDYTKNGKSYVLLVLTAGKDTKTVQADCKSIADACHEYLRCDIVCYLDEPLPLDKLAGRREAWELFDTENVSRHKPVVGPDVQAETENVTCVLDTDAAEKALTSGRYVDAVNLLRHAVKKLEDGNLLNAQNLHVLRQDYMQMVYTLLHRENIMVHELFSDEVSKKLFRASESSVFDLMKWGSYVTDKTLHAIEDAQQAETIVDKIKRYIIEHCDSDITREEIAHHVFLSPDYVSKIFKAQTGCFLKDYINEQKIERAKELLCKGSMNVSEVAMAAGFDNFSYFSTLFKKCTGHSPSQYKKHCTTPQVLPGAPAV